MAILQVKTVSMGESGQIPKIIFIQTNNTLSDVTAAGFLNGLVAQNYAFNSTDMALVVTKEVSAPPVSNFYNIVISGSDTSLSPIGGSSPPGAAWEIGGNLVGGPSVFGTLDSQNVALQAGGFTFIEFVPGSNTMDLDADFVSIDVSDTAQFSATTLFTLDSTTEIRVGGAFAPLVIVGNSTPTHTVRLAGAALTVPNIASGTQDRIMYIDNATGAVTKGPVPAAGDAWLVGGNPSIPGPGAYFGTQNAETLYMKTANIQFLSVDGTQNMVFDSADLTWNAAGTVVLFPSGSTALTVGYTGLPVQFYADNFTMNTNGGIFLNSVGQTHLNSTGNMLVECSGVGTQIFGNTTHFTGIYGNALDIYANVGNASLDCDGILNIAQQFAVTVNIASAGLATALNISNAAVTTTFDATSLLMPNMPTATGGEKIVMIDTVTGQLRISP